LGQQWFGIAPGNKTQCKRGKYDRSGKAVCRFEWFEYGHEFKRADLIAERKFKRSGPIAERNKREYQCNALGADAEYCGCDNTDSLHISRHAGRSEP
jgi:hypothetical protein